MSSQSKKNKKNNSSGQLLSSPKPAAIQKGQYLTDVVDRKNQLFEISIRHSLTSNFEFKNMNTTSIKLFDQFIKKTVGARLTWGEVENSFLRVKNGNPFTEQKVDGKSRRVAHYNMGNGNTGRIFGYREGNDFIVFALDPNHNFSS